MPVPGFLKTPLSMYEIAEQYWDLRLYPTQYLFSLLALVSEDKLEREKCIELSTPEGQEDWLNYCRRPKRTLLEVLQDFHKSTSKLNIAILFELFSTIKPRSFSIASSSHSNSIEILVAVVKYYSKLKEPRLGLASNWLKSLKEGNRIYGWIKTGTFKFLKDNNTPLIMIGPGAGVAPFRAVLQERQADKTANKQILHLFFGCRYKDKDFHFRQELKKMVQDGELALYCAFSRDQEDKIYVQHKIIEHSKEVWHLISDRHARIYVSGNSNLPDCVRDAIVQVISANGGKSEEESKQVLSEMEANGQFQVETW